MASIPFKLIRRDELQQLNERVASLESQINTATEFVKEIEKGNLTADYSLADVVGEKADVLAESLLSLRLQLKSYSIQEKERNWVTEGLAKFIDILRSKNEDVAELTDNIIRNLVKYVGANQGGLYLVNDDNPKDRYIEMAACYAYDRKKYLNQRIEIGEGLTGQAVLEKDTIYLTEIPQSYMRITSGLGNASPSNLLIVPLKIEENVFGVVEVASFDKIQQYQIEFVERLGESIASTLANVRTGQKTQVLLQQSQIQAEQMRSQEEEMRQNMEELSATQEEMQRVLKEVQDKEIYLNNLLNASSDAIMSVDVNLKIVMYNKYIYDTFAAQGIILKKGMDVFEIVKPEQIEKDKIIYANALKGETNVRREDYFGRQYEITIQPLRDADNAIVGALVTTRDVTKDAELHNQTEELLKEAQDKEKYLNELINVPKDSIFTLDKDFKILSYNKPLELRWKKC